MGIINTILKSGGDISKPSTKSYWGITFQKNLVSKTEILNKKEHTVYEKKALAHELSGIEPVEDVVILKGKEARLTARQMKDILGDMGFNVDTILSGSHSSDFTAVMNINGFVIPGWRFLANLLVYFFPRREKLLLSKLAPGRERLHIRAYGDDSGTWMIISHTDPNWMSVNLAKVFNAHVGYGAGDYTRGTKIMNQLIAKFLERLKRNQVFSQSDIDKIAGDITNKERLGGLGWLFS